MALWATETFTEATNAFNLTSHTSDSGESWTNWAGTAATPKLYNAAAGGAGVVASGATTPQIFAASATAPQLNIILPFQAWYDGSGFDSAGICFHLQAAGGAGYMCAYAQSTQKWGFYSLAGITPTLLTAAASTSVYSAGTLIAASTIEVSDNGTTATLTLKINGVTIVTANATGGSRVGTAGKRGVYFATSSAAATGMFFSYLNGDVPVTAAANVTMSGPTSGTTGSPSTNFTVGADGVISGTVVVTPSDGGAGGTFTPTTVSISSGSPTGTFTYTPATSGAKTISCTNNGSLGNPANITYTASSSGASAVTISGPSGGLVGVASTNFTVGADGVISGTVTVTPNDSGGGGSFSPTSVNISAGSPTATFTYTPASVGTKTLTSTNNGSLSNPSGSYVATAAATAVTLSGPTTGADGVASSNFTAGVNGALAANVTVTPNDSSAGGTFAPTSVTLTPGAPSATFTYTPSGVGTKTIAVTNGSGLANPASIGYVVTGVVIAPFPTKFADRVRDVASAASGATITLTNTPPASFRTFGAAFSVGDKRIPVTVVDQGNAAWMCCYATYTSSTVLTVLQIVSSSAGGVTVPTFSGSPKDVIHGPIAAAAVRRHFIDAGDYAIYPDFGNDSTAGFQQAILDAYNWDVEVIKIPPGHYKIAGALTGSGNCQLYIPRTRQAEPAKSIYLQGSSPPNFEQQGLADVTPPRNGVVLESTIAGTGTRPSVIGCEQGHASDPWVWNYTNVSVVNLCIRTKVSAGANSMCGLNLEFSAQVAKLDMLRFDVNMGLQSAPSPNSASVGIIMPPVNNHLEMNIGMVYIGGYYTGIRAGEHTKIDSLIVIGATRGIELVQSYHGSWIGLYSVEHAKYAIWMSGDHPLAIGHYDAEHNANFAWGTFAEDLHVAAGTRKVAILRATVVQAGVGYNDAGWVDNASGLMHKTVCGAGAN